MPISKTFATFAAKLQLVGLSLVIANGLRTRKEVRITRGKSEQHRAPYWLIYQQAVMFGSAEQRVNRRKVRVKGCGKSAPRLW